MLFKGIFWGLIISTPLYAILIFHSCQPVVNKGTPYKEWIVKNNIDVASNTKYIIDEYTTR